MEKIAYKAVIKTENGYITPFHKTYNYETEWELELNRTEFGVCMLPTLQEVEKWLNGPGYQFGYDTILKCRIITQTNSYHPDNPSFAPDNTLYATEFEILDEV